MGQGPLTSLSQILAEELDADWTKVRTEFAPVNPALYGFQGVVGSMSIRTLWTPLRQVGATGRAMLIEAAAQQVGRSGHAAPHRKRFRHQPVEQRED